MQASVSPNYVLLSPVSAVRLDEAADAAKGFCALPAGRTVALCGGSTISGLIDVVCEGHDYAVFRADLEERAEQLGV